VQELGKETVTNQQDQEYKLTFIRVLHNPNLDQTARVNLTGQIL